MDKRTGKKKKQPKQPKATAPTSMFDKLTPTRAVANRPPEKDSK